MTSSVNRILLIGDGAWSRKINGVILAQNTDWEVEIISARAFISMKSDLIEFVELCEKFDLFWITTTPRNQIQILQKLGKTQKKIILEKPIATNVSEISLIQDLIRNSQSKIYLSQPWTFSTLWKETKKILLTLQGDRVIRIERGGNLMKPWLAPEIDWAPHDLYLLYDYSHDLSEKSPKISLISRILKENRIQLKYTLASVKIFDIKAGYFNPRKAMWRVYLKGKEVLRLNFQTSELVDYRGTHKIVSEFSYDNPIITMLMHISKNNPDIDWVLILELYQDLLEEK